MMLKSPSLRRRTAPLRALRAPSPSLDGDAPSLDRTRPRRAKPKLSRAEAVAATQGAFYTATGVWPIVGLRSFEAVTGPKPEGWLVKTVGGLIGVAGAAMTSAALRKRVTPEIAMLGAGCAAVLAAIDVVYVARRRISPVYLLDAVAEGVLMAGWASAASELAADVEPNGEDWEIDFGDEFDGDDDDDLDDFDIDLDDDDFDDDDEDDLDDLDDDDLDDDDPDDDEV